MSVPLVLDNLLENVRALAAYTNPCRACTNITMRTVNCIHILVLCGVGKLVWLVRINVVIRPSELQKTGLEPIRRTLVERRCTKQYGRGIE